MSLDPGGQFTTSRALASSPTLLFTQRSKADTSWSSISSEAFSFQATGSGRQAHPGVQGFRLSRSLRQQQPVPKPARQRCSPFASLTWGLWQRLSGGNSGIRRTWERLSDGKAFVTASDLELYAKNNGLPTSYALSFATAVLGAAPSDGEEISYRAFANFVKSRESALRLAFNHFDRDNDGRISVQDLEASLRHVAVACPTSRCIYRCNSRIAHELYERTQVMGDSSIDFNHFRDFFLLLPQTELMVDYWLAAGRCPDLDTRVVYHDTGDASQASPWGHLVAGALAGAASRTATAPLETLRLAVMTGSLEASDLMQGAAVLMARGGGWKALFRGNAVNVMRSAPSKALDFFAFDTFKKLLGDTGGYAQTFAAAGLAGATSWTALYPLEVVRSRITTGNAPAEAGGNVFKVMRSIAAREGPSALYRGLGWSVAAIVPEAAICYGLHDLLKQTYRKWQGQEPDVVTSLAFGVMSAFTGQLVAYPLETVSRRLQVSGQPMGAVMKDLLTQGGFKAFYRGVGACMLRLVPMAMISFGTYEVSRAALVKLGELRVELECKNIQRQCQPLSLGAGAGAGTGGACDLQAPCMPCTAGGTGAGAGAEVAACAVAAPMQVVTSSCLSCPSGPVQTLGAGGSSGGGGGSVGVEGSTFVATSCQQGGTTGLVVYCDAEAVAAGLCKQQPAVGAVGGCQTCGGAAPAGGS